MLSSTYSYKVQYFFEIYVVDIFQGVNISVKYSLPYR